MVTNNVYGEKLDDNQIRLLTLLPDADPAPLHCQLQVADAVSPPEYEAISYTWGDNAGRSEIWCDSRPFSITENAAAALYRFRLPDRPRVLWMDQITINQSDPVERAKQVNLMYDIFSKARCVLMWLGPDGENLAPIAK